MNAKTYARHTYELVTVPLRHLAIFRSAWPHYVFPPECNLFCYPLAIGRGEGGKTYRSLFCFSFPFPVHLPPPPLQTPKGSKTDFSVLGSSLQKREIWHKIFYLSIMLFYKKVFSTKDKKDLGEFGQEHGNASFIVSAEEIKYCFWYNLWFDQLKLYSFYVS